MSDENVAPRDYKLPDVQTQTDAAPQAPCLPASTPEKVADRPHPITVHLGLVSPAIAIVALLVAFLGWCTSQWSMKVGQRAYLIYQVAVTNGNQVMEALRADKDIFLNYQVTVTNMGNTPADLIYPKISVVPDPHRTPLWSLFRLLKRLPWAQKSHMF